jgi:hypothetical protein
MKRKEGEWKVTDLEEALNDRPPGTEYEVHTIGEDTTFIHITFPKEWSAEEADHIRRWAQKARKEMQSDVYFAITSEELKINVDRPKPIIINMHNTRVESDELWHKIQKLEDKYKDRELRINIHNCEIKGEST